VAEFVPAAVSEIRIQSRSLKFLLKKESNQWMQKEPFEEKADPITIATFLRRIDELQSGEFLELAKVRDPQLSPPLVTIQIRQTNVGRRAQLSEPDALVLDLRLGRFDVAQKVCFAQLANDEVVLTLPGNIEEVVPRNAMAFRDHAIAGPNPADVRKLVLVRAG